MGKLIFFGILYLIASFLAVVDCVIRVIAYADKDTFQVVYGRKPVWGKMTGRILETLFSALFFVSLFTARKPISSGGMRSLIPYLVIAGVFFFVISRIIMYFDYMGKEEIRHVSLVVEALCINALSFALSFYIQNTLPATAGILFSSVMVLYYGYLGREWQVRKYIGKGICWVLIFLLSPLGLIPLLVAALSMGYPVYLLLTEGTSYLQMMPLILIAVGNVLFLASHVVIVLYINFDFITPVHIVSTPLWFIGTNLIMAGVSIYVGNILPLLFGLAFSIFIAGKWIKAGLRENSN